MLFYSYFLHYVPETYLYRNLIRSCKSKHGTKSPVFWWFHQTVNVLKMPRSRSVFSFRNSQGKLGVHNPLTPGKYAVYFTFSSTRKTWLNSALSLVKRTFYQTVNVRKISRSWLVFQLRKRQGQLGIHRHLTEGEFLVSIFCLLRVLGIFGRLRAILLPAEKKNMARLKLVGIALNINKTLRLAKEFCCFVTTVKPLLFKADTGLNWQ